MHKCVCRVFRRTKLTKNRGGQNGKRGEQETEMKNETIAATQRDEVPSIYIAEL